MTDVVIKTWYNNYLISAILCYKKLEPTTNYVLIFHHDSKVVGFEDLIHW